MNALKFQGVRFLFAGMVLVLLSTRLVRLGALAPAHGKIQFYLFLTALAVSLTALILIVDVLLCQQVRRQVAGCGQIAGVQMGQRLAELSQIRRPIRPAND